MATPTIFPRAVSSLFLSWIFGNFFSFLLFACVPLSSVFRRACLSFNCFHGFFSPFFFNNYWERSLFCLSFGLCFRWRVKTKRVWFWCLVVGWGLCAKACFRSQKAKDECVLLNIQHKFINMSNYYQDLLIVIFYH